MVISVRIRIPVAHEVGDCDSFAHVVDTAVATAVRRASAGGPVRLLAHPTDAGEATALGRQRAHLPIFPLGGAGTTHCTRPTATISILHASRYAQARTGNARQIAGIARTIAQRRTADTVLTYGRGTKAGIVTTGMPRPVLAFAIHTSACIAVALDSIEVVYQVRCHSTDAGPGMALGSWLLHSRNRRLVRHVREAADVISTARHLARVIGRGAMFGLVALDALTRTVAITCPIGAGRVDGARLPIIALAHRRAPTRSSASGLPVGKLTSADVARCDRGRCRRDERQLTPSNMNAHDTPPLSRNCQPGHQLPDSRTPEAMGCTRRVMPVFGPRFGPTRKYVSVPTAAAPPTMNPTKDVMASA